MKKLLLLAAMAVMVVSAGAQTRTKAYSGHPHDMQLSQKTVMHKKFQAVTPRTDLATRSFAPAGKQLTLDPSKLMPVARASKSAAVMPMQQLQEKSLSQLKAQRRQMVNVKPTIATQRAGVRRAAAMAESYIGAGVNYRTREVEQWTMKPFAVATSNEQTGEETQVTAFEGIIPTPEYLKEYFPNGIPVQYTQADNVITIKPQSILSYQNEAQDTTFYVTVFSANSDDEDGIINMEVGENGKLTITNGNYIILGEFANVEFDIDMDDSEAYMGWDELYANVVFHYQMETVTDQVYKGHGVDYFANQPADWEMQRGSTTVDGESTHFFVNMTPLLDIFKSLYPDGIDVEYTQQGNTIIVEPQVIASASGEKEDETEYIMLFSGVNEATGNIVLTLGDDGSLTTVDGESIIIGSWSTDKYDPTFETYTGSYSYIENVKYRLPDAAPEKPQDTSFEPDQLILFAGQSISGSVWKANYAVMGAYAPVSFTNKTFDPATGFEWSITEVDEESNVITSTDKDFGFTTKGGAVYTDFSLIASNEGVKSDPFTWGMGSYDVLDDAGNPTGEKEQHYDTAILFAGSGEGDFAVGDDVYSTMTRQNPDYDLTFYINFATPDIASQYGGSSLSTIYSYQGKPSTPLYLTGVSLPMVDFAAKDDFNLHIAIRKCSRSDTGNLTLGDIIAESDATIDNVDETYKDQSGLTAVNFNELYREDEFGLSETLDYLFIEDEFVIVIEGWDNETFSGVLGSQQYNGINESTSTWFVRSGEDRLRSYGGGWPTLFIGLTGVTYGYLHTEDNTNLQFAAQGGEKSIHVDPMYYGFADDAQTQPTHLLSIESIMVDGEEVEEVPEWLTLEVANEDYTKETYTGEDGQEHERFVNGIDYDLITTVEALPAGVERRTAQVTFMQTGARLVLNITQGEGGESLKGDVNGDGAVDVADISNVITIMAAGTNDPAGDVNGDGAVDVADISNIITIMAAN